MTRLLHEGPTSVSACWTVVRPRGAHGGAPSRWILLLSLLFLSIALHAEQRDPPIKPDKATGKLIYTPDAAGNRVPDFSSAGYGGGGVPLPDVLSRLRVESAEGDDRAHIQAAIDYVSSLAPDARGFRGAVSLAPGRFEISEQLRISASGVVLRGEEGTILVATGTDRRALISVRGKDDRSLASSVAVTEAFVPVGANGFRVKSVEGLRAGDAVVITRPGAAAWVHALGMDVSPGRQQFSWKPETVAIRWDRVVAAIDGDRITIDAPLTTALDANYGGGTVAAYSWAGRITNVGVENLRCESIFEASNPLDEQHAWDAVDLDDVRDGWVRNVTVSHFAGSAVNVGSGCSRVTVQDVTSLAPVSELGGYRRNTFLTSGQQTLFLRCHGEEGRADFSAGYLASGPNVFLECTAERSHGTSGSIGSWASGILFDNVTLDGGTLALDNRETWNQGVGWAAANSMLWQCSAPVVICRAPPTAQNWADGVWGQFVGDGWWSQVNEFINPQSLYRAQLAERMGAASLAALETRSSVVGPDLASGPSATHPGAAHHPSQEGIFESGAPSNTNPLLRRVPEGRGVLSGREAAARTQGPALQLANGLLVADGKLLIGREAGIAWWRGYLLPGREATQPAITRFAPGLSGPIHTDDLGDLTDTMVAKNEVVLRHHYGLWYDRRRMDHERMRRPDGDVWPPFYEQPFARSGQGAAWDGLSRYDLTKYNPWYFGRLREFASLARERGLVLVDEMYFQHNIIEAGAHWVDSPWRPTNNINDTSAQFTEPPPFDGDTVKMAAQFYNLSDPKYRALHRAYIRQCLANLAEQPNVIHTLTAENSGPLSFMQFWLDVVAEWESETGKHPLIALSAAKDVQDTILADAKRAAVIDVIDLTYWFRTDKAGEFAPPGGTDLAPRQHARLWKGGRASATSIANMVAEYRARFPAKAVMSGLDEADGWAFVAAGGSLAKLPRTTDASLLASLAKMKPLASAAPAANARAWTLTEGENAFFSVNLGGGETSLDLRGATGSFVVHRIDSKSGAVAPSNETVAGGKTISISSLSGSPTIVWLTRQTSKTQ